MTTSERHGSLDQIIASAKRHFGLPVKDLQALTGTGRREYRLVLPDRTIIATIGANARRIRREAEVLTELRRGCDDLPECLGVIDEVLFRSDLGARRLNEGIDSLPPARQRDLATEAVAAIFRLQHAARRSALAEKLPHLGRSEAWITEFVGAIDALRHLAGGISPRFDREAACDRIAAPARQFVKWNSRAASAALGTDGRPRWFGFDCAGMRHGAEDVAWLLGDETWPLPPEDMVDVVIAAYDPFCGIALDAYLDYLAVYLTFHAAQRLGRISREARRHGWRDKAVIHAEGGDGLHPDFAVQICRVGAYFSAQTGLTAPLTRNFEAALAGFEKVARQHADPVLRSA